MLAAIPRVFRILCWKKFEFVFKSYKEDKLVNSISKNDNVVDATLN
jgi:hypothetical protein